MSERVRVFQCEECGVPVAISEQFPVDGVLRHMVLRGGRIAWCGPITEHILADADVVRRETIKEGEDGS